MLAVVAMAALAGSGPDEPEHERRTWRQGTHAMSVGSAAIQLPSYGRGNRDFPGINVNGTYRLGVKRTPILFALHGAYQRLTFDGRRQRTSSARIESRAGLQTPLWRSAALAFSGGLAWDYAMRPGSIGRLLLGPSLNLGLQQWLPVGNKRTLFVQAEGRLAPIAWGNRTQMLCTSYCNQTHNYNPGGTGLLLSVGTSFHGRDLW